MTHSLQDKTIAGVVGLGLMGSSIITAFTVSGDHVIAVAPIPEDMDHASDNLRGQLNHACTLGLLRQPVDYYMSRIKLTEDYSCLKNCALVIECVIEDSDIKSSVYRKIEEAVPEDTIIGTNTSAIPISALQKQLKFPERFLGIHWAEPAYATRFLEIICGEQTDILKANEVSKWAEEWNKEPILLKKDIRGFITNRLMYAMYREALALEEAGVASLRDLDKAVRYDIGSWIPLMGIFQRMDYMGVQEEKERLTPLLKILSDRKRRPPIMDEIVENKDRGVHTGKGFFTYTKEEAKQWKESFSQFNTDMFLLSEKYNGRQTLEKAENNSLNESSQSR